MNTTIFGISKTTLEGWFSFLITTLTFVTGYNGFVALMNPAQSKVWLIASAVATFVVGLLNLWLRMLQGDGTANLQLPQLPRQLIQRAKRWLLFWLCPFLCVLFLVAQIGSERRFKL